MGKNRHQCNQTQPVAGDMDANEIVGNRVFKIRFVLGFGKRKQKQFAEMLGETDDNWSNWERGYGTNKLPVLFPLRVGVALCQHTKENVTLDYIYRGRFVGMDPTWIALLEAAPDRDGFAPPPARKPGRRGD